MPARNGVWTDADNLAVRERVVDKQLICQLVQQGDRIGNLHMVSLHLTDEAVPNVKDQLVQGGIAQELSLNQQLVKMDKYRHCLSSLDVQFSFPTQDS